MNGARILSRLLMIGAAFCSLGHNAVSAQAVPQIKLWSAISVTQPVVHLKEAGKLQVFFAVVNDGDTVADPHIESSHLFVNGAEPKDWAFVISNGLRTSYFTALPPGQALSFTYQLGSRYFATPGIYTVRWEGPNFRSPEITLRVMPGGN